MIAQQTNDPGKVLVGAQKNKVTSKVNLEQLRARDNKKVKGRFNYLEVPGGILEFSYRAYKGDPVMNYSLKDGEIYELPIGVARHLNNNVGRYEHKYLLDAQGKPSTQARIRIRRCIFENLEFVDIEDIGMTHIEEVDPKSIPSLIKKA